MRRVKVAPGRFVVVRSALVEKAARIRMPTKAEFDTVIELERKKVQVLLGPKGLVSASQIVSDRSSGPAFVWRST